MVRAMALILALALAAPAVAQTTNCNTTPDPMVSARQQQRDQLKPSQRQTALAMLAGLVRVAA